MHSPVTVCPIYLRVVIKFESFKMSSATYLSQRVLDSYFTVFCSCTKMSSWTRMERVFLLTKGCGEGGEAGREERCQGPRSCRWNFVCAVSLDPAVDVPPQLSDCFSHSLNKSFSLDVKPSLSFFSPGLYLPPKRPWELGRGVGKGRPRVNQRRGLWAPV